MALFYQRKILTKFYYDIQMQTCLAGDLNSRIGDMQDFIPSDDVEFVFGDTENSSDPLDINRKSKDKHVICSALLSLIFVALKIYIYLLVDSLKILMVRLYVLRTMEEVS